MAHREDGVQGGAKEGVGKRGLAHPGGSEQEDHGPGQLLHNGVSVAVAACWEEDQEGGCEASCPDHPRLMQGQAHPRPIKGLRALEEAVGKIGAPQALSSQPRHNNYDLQKMNISDKQIILIKKNNLSPIGQK